MPESEAVYQPTTVGYTYDAGGDAHDTGNGIRSGFSRIIFRHKVSTRKWAEWVLLSVAICASVAGLTTLLVNLLASSNCDPPFPECKQDNSTKIGEPEEPIDDGTRGSIAVGATITLAGLLLGCGWAWLRFFRRSKSPRGGITRGSGQYGPVLTEVPSQMMPSKMTNNAHETRAIALSDQEEETRTLMPDASGGGGGGVGGVGDVPVVATSGDVSNGDIATGQIAG